VIFSEIAVKSQALLSSYKFINTKLPASMLFMRCHSGWSKRWGNQPGAVSSSAAKWRCDCSDL
jgi:hypothetical protein